MSGDDGRGAAVVVGVLDAIVGPGVLEGSVVTVIEAAKIWVVRITTSRATRPSIPQGQRPLPTLISLFIILRIGNEMHGPAPGTVHIKPLFEVN